MGSWNGTCGITKMPIKYMEKINLAVIQLNANIDDSSGFCHSTGIAKPVSFLFSGNYDSNGLITNIENELSSKLFIDFFNKGIKNNSIIITENKKFDKNNIYEILKLIERELILMKNKYWDEKENRIKETFTKLGVIMFHSNVIDILTNELYKNNNFFLSDYTKENIEKDVKIILSYIDKETYRKEKEKLYSIVEKTEDENIIDDIYKKISLLDLKYNSNHLNEFNNKFRFLLNRDYSNPVVFQKYIYMMKTLPENDKCDAKHLLINMLDLIHIFIHTNTSWTPQSGKGSQEENDSFFIAIADSIYDIIDKRFLEDYEIGEELICTKTLNGFKKNIKYKIVNIKNGKVIFENSDIHLNFDDIYSYFVYN